MFLKPLLYFILFLLDAQENERLNSLGVFWGVERIDDLSNQAPRHIA